MTIKLIPTFEAVGKGSVHHLHQVYETATKVKVILRTLSLSTDNMGNTFFYIILDCDESIKQKTQAGGRAMLVLLCSCSILLLQGLDGI